MDLEVRTKAEEWLHSNIDQESKDQIQAMLDAEDQSELVDSFYKDLEFGTGGLRGVFLTHDFFFHIPDHGQNFFSPGYKFLIIFDCP